MGSIVELMEVIHRTLAVAVGTRARAYFLMSALRCNDPNDPLRRFMDEVFGADRGRYHGAQYPR